MAQSATSNVTVTWTAAAGGTSTAADSMTVTWTAGAVGGTATDTMTVTWQNPNRSFYRWDRLARTLVPVSVGKWDPAAKAFVWFNAAPNGQQSGTPYPSPVLYPSPTLYPGA